MLLCTLIHCLHAARSVLSLTEPGGENLNPLPPCGVCSSWLEKIYEVNQEFRLITFSDATLAKVAKTFSLRCAGAHSMYIPK